MRSSPIRSMPCESVPCPCLRLRSRSARGKLRPLRKLTAQFATCVPVAARTFVGGAPGVRGSRFRPEARVTRVLRRAMS